MRVQWELRSKVEAIGPGEGTPGVGGLQREGVGFGASWVAKAAQPIAAASAMGLVAGGWLRVQGERRSTAESGTGGKALEVGCPQR